MRRSRSGPGSVSMDISTSLELHGVGASSSPHSLVYLPSQSNENDTLVYASNAIINLARQELPPTSSSSLYNVNRTLRTGTTDMSSKTSSSRSITAMKLVQRVNSTPPFSDTSSPDELKDATTSSIADTDKIILVCAFSDGTITLWVKATSKNSTCSMDKEGDDLSEEWEEYVVRYGSNMKSEGETTNDKEPKVESITDIDGVFFDSAVNSEDPGEIKTLVTIVTASSYGVHSHAYEMNPSPSSSSLLSSTCLSSTPSCSVKVNKLPIQLDNLHCDSHVILACGTAMSKSNKIQIYTKSFDNHSEDKISGDYTSRWDFHGHLTGHLGWISCLSWLDMSVGQDASSSCLMLASGSQDTRIRLWNFHSAVLCENDTDLNSNMNEKSHEDEMKDDSIVGDDDDDEDDNYLEEGEARINVRIQIDDDRLMDVAVTLEAVLMGHEDNITSVSWRPSSGTRAPTLLSSSMDRSILIWMEEIDDSNEEPLDPTRSLSMGNIADASGNNIWVPIARVGTAGGILGGSIGFSLLGFVDAIWSTDGQSIIGHGYGGSIHFWSSESSESSVERWHGHPGITGHFRGVSDICWEATKGHYLLSAGLDQTCRLWSTIPLGTGISEGKSIWREIGRPQVHGYDLNAVACIGTGINDGEGELIHRFVSGADEKEARAFDAPHSILKLLDRIHTNMAGVGSGDRVERAYIPSLGLSNRATADDAMEEGGDGGASAWANTKRKTFDSTDTKTNGDESSILQALPFERDLGVASVWPETRKLFGHQTELICLTSTARWCTRASSDTPVIVASSCKARDTENAAIRLWDVERNKCIDVLKDAHNSTVVSLSFSPHLKFLAASGKDRRLSIWYRHGKSYHLASIVESAHKRIVWSIDFCPHDSTLLASGSRDGFVKLWHIDDNSTDETVAVKVSEIHRWQPGIQNGSSKAEPVTAVAFAPQAFNHSFNQGDSTDATKSYIMAIGYESGLIELWGVVPPAEESETDVSVRLLHSLPHNSCHIDAVKKLEWKPESAEESLTLASCSTDHGVRIYRVDMKLVEVDN